MTSLVRRIKVNSENQETCLHKTIGDKIKTFQSSFGRNHVDQTFYCTFNEPIFEQMSQVTRLDGITRRPPNVPAQCFRELSRHPRAVKRVNLLVFLTILKPNNERKEVNWIKYSRCLPTPANSIRHKTYFRAIKLENVFENLHRHRLRVVAKNIRRERKTTKWSN